MRIVLVNAYARVTGGADYHCLELAKGLRARGHEVVFLSTFDERNIEKSGFFVPAIVTNETRDEITGIGAAKVAGSALWYPSAAAVTREMLGSFSPDIMHVHKIYPQLSVAPVALAARRGTPIVQTLHDYEFVSASPVDHTGGLLDRDETRSSYRLLNTTLFGIKTLIHRPRVDSWISVSRYTDHVYRQHGIHTKVLPNFTEEISFSRQSFEDRVGVLFVGRLSEEKGVRHLLELARMVPRIPVVVAGDGPLSAQVQYAAQTSENVSYLGWLDRAAITRELMSARLVLVPSLWREPAGLAALEAMAVGTPLVVYDNGGLAEYVADAAAGLIVPPTVTSLVDAIISLYDDPQRWESLSINACDAVKKNHTRSVYLNRLEQIYIEAIGSRQAGRR